MRRAQSPATSYERSSIDTRVTGSVHAQLEVSGTPTGGLRFLPLRWRWLNSSAASASVPRLGGLRSRLTKVWTSGRGAALQQSRDGLGSSKEQRDNCASYQLSRRSLGRKIDLQRCDRVAGGVKQGHGKRSHALFTLAPYTAPALPSRSGQACTQPLLISHRESREWGQCRFPEVGIQGRRRQASHVLGRSFWKCHWRTGLENGANDVAPPARDQGSAACAARFVVMLSF
jgi:hypothetical protein